ncbi:MAG: sugar nucleotide-binding protein [Oligoflexia bacterium]|nr:sugar nucleotide-binding protein [Oligoflexia bacterium]
MSDDQKKALSYDQIKTKKRKTVLIFGISSFIGSNIAYFLKQDYRVIGTYFSCPVKFPDILTINCDVLNRNSVQTMIYTFRPEITIYAIGMSSLSDCDRQEKIANALNTIGVFNVATYTERYGSKLCYISSAHVFSGNNQIYGENDGPDPLTTYGRTKASAEFFIQKSCLNYLLFRCCNFYGRSINPRQSTHFELMQKKFNNEEPFSCDSNIHSGYLDINYLSQILKMAIDNDVANRLFQLCSSNVASFYDFANLYAKIFRANSQLIIKGRWAFHEVRSEYHDAVIGNLRYFQLSNDNLENFFGIHMPSIEESLYFTLYRLKGKIIHEGASETNSTSVQFI